MKTMIIKYQGKHMTATIVGDYKVTISQKMAGVAGKLANDTVSIELDQCRRCGVWCSQDEELYGDGYCTECAEPCNDCDRNFCSDDLHFTKDGNLCKECLKKRGIGCPNCGCVEFTAHQQCYHDIVVSLNNTFESDSGIYESETPYGPYGCINCDYECEELPKENSLTTGE